MDVKYVILSVRQVSPADVVLGAGSTVLISGQPSVPREIIQLRTWGISSSRYLGPRGCRLEEKVFQKFVGLGVAWIPNFFRRQ